MGFLRNKNLVVAAAIFLVIAIAFASGIFRRMPEAHRWCTNTCLAMRGCNLDFSDGVPRKLGPNCFIYQNQCNNWCGNTQISNIQMQSFAGPVSVPVSAPVTVPFGPWGAVAYDAKTTAWGIANSADNIEHAKSSAMSYCTPYGQNCEVVDTFKDICVSVATGPKNTVAWVKDKDLEKATIKAVAKCNKQTGSKECIYRHGNCYPDNTRKDRIQPNAQ